MTTSSATRSDSERFPALDAIRGLAALAVVGFHAYKDIVKLGPGANGPLTTLALSMDWGVPVFFVLSGFLIYTPFAVAIAEGRERPDTLRFLFRRALRILPAYWLALIVYGTIAKPGDLWGGDGPLRYGLLLQIYDGQTVYHVLATAWTLALEATFYLALPLLAMLVARFVVTGAQAPRSPGVGLARHLAALGAIVIASYGLTWLGLAPLYRTVGEQPGMAAFTLPGSFDLFAAGMVVAIVRAHRSALRAVRLRVGTRRWALVRHDATWIGAAALAYLGALVFEARHITPWGSTILPTAAAAALLVPAVFRPAGSVLARTLGRSTLLVGLGTLSYGLYLWHWPIQELAMANGWSVPHTWAGWFVATTVVTAVALVPAWLSYRLLERPLLRWGQAKVGARRMEADPAPASRAERPPASGPASPPAARIAARPGVARLLTRRS